MPPTSSPSAHAELFRSALVNRSDRRHPLVRRAALIDGKRCAIAVGRREREGIGRPGLLTRRIASLQLIKQTGCAVR